MRELVDADSASLPTASTDGDKPQQRKIVSRANRACGSKVGTPPPRKTWAPKRGMRNAPRAHASRQQCFTMKKSRRGDIAAPNTSEEGRQEPG